MKSQIKMLAQERLMRVMQNEINFAYEKGVDETVRDEMLVQFRRVEKFLGYNPESWSVSK